LDDLVTCSTAGPNAGFVDSGQDGRGREESKHVEAHRDCFGMSVWAVCGLSIASSKD
jgi:hypothetical protein